MAPTIFKQTIWIFPQQLGNPAPFRHFTYRSGEFPPAFLSPFPTGVSRVDLPVRGTIPFCARSTHGRAGRAVSPDPLLVLIASHKMSWTRVLPAFDVSEFQEIELSYGHGRLTCWVRNAPKIWRKTKTDPKGRTRLKCQEKETTIGPL